MRKTYLDDVQEIRNLAAEMFAQGRANCDIALELGVCRQSVSRWHTLWLEQGAEGLKVKPHGHARRINDEQWRRVEQALLEDPRAHGYETDLWTLDRIADLIEKKTGIKYHSGHVWKVLTRFGWSCQKPERRARERNEEEIARWRVESWPLMKGGRKKPEQDLSS